MSNFSCKTFFSFKTVYPYSVFILLATSLFIPKNLIAADNSIQKSQKHAFKITTITDKLSSPWGLEFLPDGRILVTEKTGLLRIIKNDKLLAKSIEGLPKIRKIGQGGLLDIIAHPNFDKNHWIYFSYASKDSEGAHTNLARAVLKDNKLSDIKIFFTVAKSSFGVHFGSRLVFDKNNHLYVTVGDHGYRNNAQDLSSLPGSVLRFNDDGTIPKDNPFVNKKGAQAAIFTYGNRNPQGIAIQPTTGLIWESEFAPQGGDEINIITAGTNYGWPIITYGEEYGGGKIGETHKEGLAQPVKYWIPSSNPSGITFYSGNKFPKWKGDLFVASLRGSVIRLEIEGKKILSEEYLLKGFKRVRHVKEGPDGFIYVLTDTGKLVKLESVKP